jgi:hypothetical protein
MTLIFLLFNKKKKTFFYFFINKKYQELAEITDTTVVEISSIKKEIKKQT